MRLALALLIGWFALPAAAVTCENITYLGKSYTACDVDPAVDDLRLFLKDEDRILGSFRAIEGLAGVTALPFAMNAGMYHADRAPVGHYVENGVQVMRVIPNAGPGNFGLLPNGVFCITDTTAQVIETLRYVAESPACRDATQSGPMLVIDGALHPRFLPDGTSRFLRNGVGTSVDGDRAVFVISNEAVSFHEFASFFRDHLQLPNALYFDGKVSRLHAPALGRSDFGAQMGPIVGVVE
ncbi:phosphodiester glycosidase family protein [Yoonia vestfoldensis]|uniref:Phosphodiester glycosidase n=1 Tax=Yoonia vestfoldensis TaxID=245188 RepID=A0A1Y0E804_9RHOB|nr:phosphodiester glycosidase family protein [Yoonia vestfoldensis]ART99511.1 phosphodiester glycosidase [Yoonia vestfoldensis]